MSPWNRVWFALAAAVLAIGGAQAGLLDLDLQSAGPRPAVWSFGPPLEGDRGVYALETFEVKDGKGVTRYRDDAFQPFEVVGRKPVLDAEGAWHDAVVMDIHGGSHGLMGGGIPVEGAAWSIYATQTNLYAFDAGTDELVAKTHEGRLDPARATPAGSLEGIQATRASTYYPGAAEYLHRVHRPGAEDLCGLWPARSLTADAGDLTPRFRAGCLLAGRYDERYDFEQDGAEVLDGRWCLRFRATNEDGDRVVRLWRCLGVPYPQRIELQHAAFERTYTRYELTSFVQGSKPLDAPALPPPRNLPPLDWQPAKPWGPASEGMDHPFPLSAAWTAGGRLNATVASFLAAHDAPRPSHIGWDSWMAPEATVYEWTYSALAADASGIDKLTATVRRTDSPQDSRTDVLEVTRAHHEDSFTRLEWEGAPQRLPTIASMLARASASREDNLLDVGVVGWTLGGHLGPAPCSAHGEPDLPPCRIEAQITVRSSASTSTHPGESVWDRNITEASATFAADGRLLSHGTARQTSSGTRGTQAVGDSGPAQVAMTVRGPDWTPRASVAETTAWALVGAVVGFLVPSLKNAGGWVLFSRVTEAGALRHPTRSQIYDAIRARPGLGAEHLERDLQVARGTLRHHLRTLRFVGLVVVVQAGNATAYFAKGVRDRRVMAAIPLARSTGARAALEHVSATPGLNGEELAARVGLEPASLSHHMRRLRRAGIVRAERDGRSRRYYATPFLQQVLEDTQPDLAGGPGSAGSRVRPGQEAHGP